MHQSKGLLIRWKIKSDTHVAKAEIKRQRKTQVRQRRRSHVGYRSDHL